MLLRLAAALMFVSAGALFGSIRAGVLSKRLKICRATGDLMRKLIRMLRTSGMNVYELSRELKRDDIACILTFVEQLPECFSPDVSYCDAWKNSLAVQDELPDEEKDVLIRLGGIIGSSDACGQIASIEALLSELTATETLRREELLRKGRLYRSTGILFGIMTGLIIL